MDNLARKKKEPQYVQFIDITKHRPGNWQYIDVDKFEREIREDETRKWVELRRRERARKKLRKEAFWSMVLATLAVRVGGAILGAASIGVSLYFHDATLALAIAPIALLLIICPGHNNINNEIDNYILRKKKEEEKNVR